jgi:pyruvate formate lyase activating enzyme
VSGQGHTASRSVLRVGGLTPFSLSDWPGQLSAVVFCQGCPWRCAYCHNPHLIPAQAEKAVAWSDVVAFLETRRGLLDAVVFSGGEPTAQRGIVRAIAEAKKLGFRVGLHTSGAYPRRLARLLPVLDWVAIDIKAPFDRYEATTGVGGSGETARSSAGLIIASDVEHEFRTTVHPALLPLQELPALGRELAALGARHYALQEFRRQGCPSAELVAAAADFHIDEPGLKAELAPLFASFSIRRGT